MILTGTKSEVKKMTDLLYGKLSNTTYIFKEMLSRNTVDNIVNSFSMIMNIRNLQIPQYDMSGHVEYTEVISYRSYHIISSEYHIPRIKFICSLLNNLKNLDIIYHSATTEDQNLLKYRERNENLIS